MHLFGLLWIGKARWSKKLREAKVTPALFAVQDGWLFFAAKNKYFLFVFVISILGVRLYSSTAKMWDVLGLAEQEQKEKKKKNKKSKTPGVLGAQLLFGILVYRYITSAQKARAVRVA